VKAFRADKYGSMDFFGIKETQEPVPKKNEVLVKVHAVAINDWDYGYLQANAKGGLLVRLFNGWSAPKSILGCDVAGTVVSVGSNVRRFKPGDAVFGDLSSYTGGFGGFAEYVSAAENRLIHKPERMSFEQAAAIPQAGVLALQALLAGGPLKAGQNILINGAGGGVGTMGIQLAKLHDVEVTGVDSASKLDMLRSLGFDHVIDYTKEDFTQSGKRYDLIIDAKTTRPASSIARVLNPGGTYATVGGTSHMGRFILFGKLLSLRFKKRMGLIWLKPNFELAYLCDLFEEGKFKPVIDGSYQFTDTDMREALRCYGAAEHKGKLVVTVANS
jgi:NADPH:quinone reductase-like Zn-dependent oxidoreductase